MIVAPSPFQRVNVAQGQSLVINPLNLGPIVYLSSKLGLDAFADGAPVTPIWPDQSGNGRDATANVPGTMRRAGPNTSLNGGPTVQFNGQNSPTGSNYQGALPATGPSTANGYHYMFYGRFRSATNAFGQSEVWGDGTDQRPQLIYENGGSKKYAFRDQVGTFQGNTFAPFYGLIEYIFNPPNDGTGIAEAYASFVAQNINHVWSWSTAAATGYIFGANSSDNIAMNSDMCVALWFGRVLTGGERVGVAAYLQSQFG